MNRLAFNSKNFLLFLCLSFFISCNSTEQHANIRVAVAANFYPLMLELKQDFERLHAVEVDLISGSSGVLSSQIRQGAPYDAFFSADLDFSMDLYEDGYCKKGPKIYAKGQMVLCSNTGAVDVNALCVGGENTKIGIANPKTAPYGKAALRFLQTQTCFSELEPRLVFANNINQLDQYISNGVVGLGITAASSIEMKSFLKDHQILSFTEGLEQTCILLDGRKTPHRLSQQFLDYILSEEIQEIIVSKGYRL